MNRGEAYQEMVLAAQLAGSQMLPQPKNPFYVTPTNNPFEMEPWPDITVGCDVVFMLGTLNHWNRTEGKKYIQAVIDIGKPLVVSVPKVLYPDDATESLWHWSDFSEFKITMDASTWAWLIFRLGA